jgi:hypothetical protein
MVNDLKLEENCDRDAAARALGLCPTTFPASVQVPAQIIKPIATPLSDEEWSTISVILPKLPVPKPDADFKDRVFIDAVLWWIEARVRNFSWTCLPPELGPQSSREHRHRRWCLLGYWSDIADKLEADGRLSADRFRAFRLIADDAESRKVALLERRRRLTDVGRAGHGFGFAP